MKKSLYLAGLQEVPLQTRKVRILKVGLFIVWQSRGAAGHAVLDIRHCMTKRLAEGGRVGHW